MSLCGILLTIQAYGMQLHTSFWSLSISWQHTLLYWWTYFDWIRGNRLGSSMVCSLMHVLFLHRLALPGLHFITLHCTAFPGSKVSQNDCRMWNISCKYNLSLHTRKHSDYNTWGYSKIHPHMYINSVNLRYLHIL
jgi:hypothetical protein